MGENEKQDEQQQADEDEQAVPDLDVTDEAGEAVKGGIPKIRE